MKRIIPVLVGLIALVAFVGVASADGPYTCGGISSTASEVCSGRGDCVDTDTCECDPGFTGDQCQDEDLDEDQDGYYAPQDCDDSNPTVYPGADELCDGVDNDCDEEVDEGCPLPGAIGIPSIPQISMGVLAVLLVLPLAWRLRRNRVAA